MCWMEVVTQRHLKMSWSDGTYAGLFISAILSRKLKEKNHYNEISQHILKGTGLNFTHVYM